MRYKPILLLIILLCLTVTLFTQTTGSINGRVIDQNQNPVANAHINLTRTDVYIIGHGISTISDDSGQYNILDIPPGTYNIFVGGRGCDDYRQRDVVIQADDTLTIDFTLQLVHPPREPNNPKTVPDPDAIKSAAISDIQAVLALTPLVRNPNRDFHLTILYTNDLHGRMGNMERYTSIIDSVRAEVPNVLLLDAGDLYRRGPNEKQHGAVEIEILNNMRYDAMTLGNSEFPLNDRELIDMAEHTILKTAQFPILCGNVTINGEYIKGVEPYIIKRIDNINVGIIGVTSSKPWDRSYPLAKRYNFVDPVIRVTELVAETKPLSNVQILLSHAGFFKDLQMQGVSAIISSDSHLSLYEPTIIKDGDKRIPLVSAGGEDDNHLGRLDLVYEYKGGKWELKRFEGKLY